MVKMDVSLGFFLLLLVGSSDGLLFANLLSGLTSSLTSGVSHSTTSTAAKLGSYHGNQSLVSVSGLSAGGAMAVQFHVAYSGSVMGMASFAGVAYHCSGGSVATALTTCMSSPSGIQQSNLVQFARSEANAGRIDPTSDMSQDKVFIWTGTNDGTVRPESADKIQAFYEPFVNIHNLKLVKKNGGAHTFPTDNYGNSCGQSTSPYISNCNYNGAYEALNFIYGNLVRPTASTSANGKFLQFDQTEFVTSRRRSLFDPNSYMQGLLNFNNLLLGGSGSTGNSGSGSTGTGSTGTGSTSTGTNLLLSNPILDYWQKLLGSAGSLPGLGTGSLPGLGTGSLPGLGTGSLPGLSSSTHSMDSVGFVYIPTGCQTQETDCKVHVVFHGCKQGRNAVGDTFAKHAGYNEVGEVNDIIIIYPQIVPEMMSNPNGCFDWWGYADSNFANKNGVQMKAVKKMIDRVTGP